MMFRIFTATRHFPVMSVMSRILANYVYGYGDREENRNDDYYMMAIIMMMMMIYSNNKNDKTRIYMYLLVVVWGKGVT